MSASRRLSRLKRGPLVNDVSNVKVQRNINNNNMNNQKKETGKMVNAFTVLSWHEQRINEIDQVVSELSTKTDKNEIIISLVATIEALEKKLELLSKGYDSLVKQVKSLTSEGEGEDIKNQVQKELNTVKLNITEN